MGSSNEVYREEEKQQMSNSKVDSHSVEELKSDAAKDAYGSSQTFDNIKKSYTFNKADLLRAEVNNTDGDYEIEKAANSKSNLFDHPIGSQVFSNKSKSR